ncbi:UDP-N-acetylmuramate--L-alanine ligase [Adhaeribacter rhizoryzae]|uniref:UDP-N-acetylmuramate--L-alanine ligase n=1 Tax=Adhaeribacter rhizoryzae TaxID=2607907 RepID=A0A5M6DP91_9BACT|nr:UDP-N-acetylmuramate--L-alanine ligase [Adhaeribacter rhizoryzae]KAA5549341.1 UDP-N-acetylmuramate--L-alanine ligase [Adhaeribacter rhizoryzae]
MKLAAYKYIYFLGIGGIGMSAIARWFRSQGYPVWGYDKTETPLTQALSAEGILIHYDDNIQNIPAEVKENKEATLVILTPAIPKEHQEWHYLQAEGFTIKKRSEVLGLITQSAYTVAVAGTHGKTTTSSMVAHLLHQAGVNASAFLGGIAVNFNSNLVLAPDNTAPETVVVEADEYDRSFLRLFPDIAIVTSSDADHLDIYGDKEELIKSFGDFISQIRPNGYLILNEQVDSRVVAKIDPSVKIIRYAFAQSEVSATAVTAAGRTFTFSLKSSLGNIPGLELRVPGFHNVENMLAAATAAQLVKVTAEQIRMGVNTYEGVHRRFEYIVDKGKPIYIDDYAHHPSEIDAFIRSLKALYPGKKLKVIFQPHLYTRTRDFADAFAQSLSQIDEVALLEIYPAREKPIPGVTAQLILEKINGPKKYIISKEEVLKSIKNNNDIDILVTVGAGDIDTLVKPIKQLLEGQNYVSEA